MSQRCPSKFPGFLRSAVSAECSFQFVKNPDLEGAFTSIALNRQFFFFFNGKNVGRSQQHSCHSNHYTYMNVANSFRVHDLRAHLKQSPPAPTSSFLPSTTCHISLPLPHIKARPAIHYTAHSSTGLWASVTSEGYHRPGPGNFTCHKTAVILCRVLCFQFC